MIAIAGTVLERGSSDGKWLESCRAPAIVFLLSRIREHYDRSGDNKEAVALGSQSTVRIITGAALIIVVVFTGTAAGRLVMLQQIRFGLAVAVLIDATIVRSILVPAFMLMIVSGDD